ncbi:hypothetical protein JQ824_06100 [Brachyspira hyodysenteriae]|uniref:Uncharacterized protein n=1 Tax=Brachyspira hyodysenteriae (strain ATCC 49526 / WA1) TaxID=565034 RepID=A0A3B6VAG6_BRAHW|nr:hypothetical protein [Brachyspira hyodysenteriae]ACN84459.1 hypothetical protein BHWA1_01999 [Brachyspira hyodysenteriae WA1]KLI13922.1 hypothetical protein SU46_12290 [Brachyspira hyodysenteriae]KLI16519.1 hypothetical protein SU44_06210 [Brachyspira hyodysenteriae]KLI21270.1 hypothetical protein SU43_10340 [Brachyspira hyodysenteriae]KLI30373.1 hypothetical protein SZ48_13070 [Brachyspira hyodysenteriae]
MKTKIFLLFTFLILAVSCSKNNPLDSSGITIANYEGTYTGKGKYMPGSSEENFTLVVSKDSTVVLKVASTSKSFTFNNFTMTDDKSYNSTKTEDGSTLIFSLIFDGNGNVNFSLIIQDNNTGTSEIYSSDKLTKTAS